MLSVSPHIKGNVRCSVAQRGIYVWKVRRRRLLLLVRSSVQCWINFRPKFPISVLYLTFIYLWHRLTIKFINGLSNWRRTPQYNIAKCALVIFTRSAAGAIRLQPENINFFFAYALRSSCICAWSSAFEFNEQSLFRFTDLIDDASKPRSSVIDRHSYNVRKFNPIAVPRWQIADYTSQSRRQQLPHQRCARGNVRLPVAAAESHHVRVVAA